MTVNQWEDRTDDKIVRQWTSENMTQETNGIQIIWRETMNETMVMRNYKIKDMTKLIIHNASWAVPNYLLEN